MTRDKKKQGKRNGKKFSTLNPAAAGLDVRSTFHVVAVAPDRDSEPVCTFQSFTADLHALAAWLHTGWTSNPAIKNQKTTGSFEMKRRWIRLQRAAESSDMSSSCEEVWSLLPPEIFDRPRPPDQIDELVPVTLTILAAVGLCEPNHRIEACGSLMR